MNIINKSALNFLLVTLIGFNCTTVFADTNNTSAPIISETIKLVEDALVQVNKSDFSAAQLLLKSARLASAKITGDEKTLKAANDAVVQGQIQAKYGDLKKSSDELDKALKLYKTL